MGKGLGGELIALMVVNLEGFILSGLDANPFLCSSLGMLGTNARTQLVGIQARMRISALGSRIEGLGLLVVVSLGGRVSDVPTVGPGT